jgi:nitroreductase
MIMRFNVGMEFREVVRRRRMVRAYDPSRPVARAAIDDLLQVATHAPSAGFSQGWHFLVLDTAMARERYWAATTDVASDPDTWLAGMRTAPVLIVAFSDKQAYLDRYAEPDKGQTDCDEARWPVPYWHVDTGMASVLILLAAVDSGLGACFFGIPPARRDALRDAFGVPDRFSSIGTISVGYRAADRRSPSLRRGRRPMRDVVSYGSFARAD